MRKAVGWLLMAVGGLCFMSSVISIPVSLASDGATLGERVLIVLFGALFALTSGSVCWLGVKLKTPQGAKKPMPQESPQPKGKTGRPTEKWVTSQLPALYVQKGKDVYRDRYIRRLESLGFSTADAQKMFDFERDVIHRFPKQYLLDPKFTKSWVFDLKQPFFQQYPKTKEEILRERWLTVSELCKIVDEAEWHFWNSHERTLPDAVWQEICAWRLKGPGAAFLVQYFKMVEEATGIPEDSLAKLSAEQGRHLSRRKWG